MNRDTLQCLKYKLEILARKYKSLSLYILSNICEDNVKIQFTDEKRALIGAPEYAESSSNCREGFVGQLVPNIRWPSPRIQ